MQSTVFKIIANWNYFPLVYVRNIVNEICYQKKKKSTEKSFKQSLTFLNVYFKSVEC